MLKGRPSAIELEGRQFFMTHKPWYLVSAAPDGRPYFIGV
jgi:hypothetical protein